MYNENDEDVIVLEDENGKVVKFKLLFSIIYEKTNTRYIYVLDPDEEGSVLVFSCDDDGNVISADLDNDNDLNAFIEETFEAYQNGDLVPSSDENSSYNEYQEKKEENECENKEVGCSCSCDCDCSNCEYQEKKK